MMIERIGKRFLEPRQFLEYARDLQIFDTPYQEALLEFLERKGVLTPVVRVRWPAEIVRHFWNIENAEHQTRTLAIETDGGRLAAAEELSRRITYWSDVHWPTRLHPLDDPKPSFNEFIEAPASAEFQPWSSFDVHVGWYYDRPQSRRAVDTFYRYWQVFALADSMEMGADVIINFIDQGLLSLVAEGKFKDLKDLAVANGFWYHKGRGRAGLLGMRSFEASFETLAFFLAYSERALRETLRDQGPNATTLDETHSRLFQEQKSKIACESMERCSVSLDTLLEFLKWQCRRWDDWQSMGRQALADEWRENVSASINLFSTVTRKVFEDVVNDVGKATGHVKNALDVMFPDPVVQQKERALITLSELGRTAPASSRQVGLGIDTSDCRELLKWVDQHELYQFLWFFGNVESVARRADVHGLAGLAREVQGLSLSFEHIITKIGELAALQVFQDSWARLRHKAGMKGKVKWLWDGTPVSASLASHWDATQTDQPISTRLNQIGSVTCSGGYTQILQDLLTAGLTRNYGAHVSLQGLSRKQSLELVYTLLRSILYSWKHAVSQGIIITSSAPRSTS